MAGAGPLDMSLDDIIKNNKKSGSSNSRGRGRGRSTGPGPERRLPNRGTNRTAPYAAAKAPETTWQHDMFVDQGAAYSSQLGRASAIETGSKLYVSNLEYGVSNEDIKDLFSEVGDLKRYAIHYDKSGRSKGTAEVVFSRRADAIAAIKRYNDVQLDGKPMKIEMAATNIVTPVVPAAVGPNGAFGHSNGVLGRGGGQGRGRPRGGRGVGGRGRGRGRNHGDNKFSAEDLDADLEKYHAEAMETTS